MPVLNPRISAARGDSRVCDQRSAVSAQPLNLRNFRLAEGHPRCPTGEFVANRKLIAESWPLKASGEAALCSNSLQIVRNIWAAYRPPEVEPHENRFRPRGGMPG